MCQNGFSSFQMNDRVTWVASQMFYSGNCHSNLKKGKIIISWLVWTATQKYQTFEHKYDGLRLKHIKLVKWKNVWCQMLQPSLFNVHNDDDDTLGNKFPIFKWIQMKRFFLFINVTFYLFKKICCNMLYFACMLD